MKSLDLLSPKKRITILLKKNKNNPKENDGQPNDWNLSPHSGEQTNKII